MNPHQEQQRQEIGNDPRLLLMLKALTPRSASQPLNVPEYVSTVLSARSLQELADRIGLPIKVVRAIALTTEETIVHLSQPLTGRQLNRMDQIAVDVMTAADGLGIDLFDVMVGLRVANPTLLTQLAIQTIINSNFDQMFPEIKAVQGFLPILGAVGNLPRVESFFTDFADKICKWQHDKSATTFLRAAAKFAVLANSLEFIIAQEEFPELRRATLDNPYLDVASGFNIGRFLGRWPADKKLIALDPHPFVGSYVKTSAQLLENPNVTAEESMLSSFKYSAGSFGVVRLKHAQYYVPELHDHFSKLTQSISQAGALVVQCEANRADRQRLVDFYGDKLAQLIQEGWTVKVTPHRAPQCVADLDTIVATRDSRMNIRDDEKRAAISTLHGELQTLKSQRGYQAGNFFDGLRLRG